MKYRPILTQVIFIITLILLTTLTALKYMEIEGKEWASMLTIPLTILTFSFLMLYFYLVKRHRRNR